MIKMNNLEDTFNSKVLDDYNILETSVNNKGGERVSDVMIGGIISDKEMVKLQKENVELREELRK